MFLNYLLGNGSRSLKQLGFMMFINRLFAGGIYLENWKLSDILVGYMLKFKYAIITDTCVYIGQATVCQVY